MIATDESIELLKDYANHSKPFVGVGIHNSMMECCSLVPRSLPFKAPEVGVLYRPFAFKKLNDYIRKNRSKYGVTLLDQHNSLHEARQLVRKNNWMILIFDQHVENSGYLTFFLDRVATTTGFHQFLANAYKTDVLAFYGQRTGFWEGNLHVDKITEGKKEEPVILKTNYWLEEKLTQDKKFSNDWLWMQNRWNPQSDVSKNLNLDYRKNLIDDCKQFYHWEALPRNNRIWLRMPIHLGNCIKWIPFVKAIRQSRPDAQVTLLANRKFTPLLEALKVADSVVSVPKRNTNYYRNFLKLRYEFPDTYYQLAHSLPSDIEAKLVNAPRRYGIRWPGNSRILLTDTFDVDPGWDTRKNHQTELWDEFLRYFGLQGEVDFSPLKLAPGTSVINPLRCLQTESHDAPYFGLISGAGNNPEKCWPVDYWIECVASLMDLYPDGNICLFGAESDLPISRKIIEQFEPGSVHNFTGSTNLMQFVMALKSCSVVISNDCGGLHLANALGVATVGLYGLTNPVYTRPIYNSPSHIIQPAGCPKHGGTPINEICLPQILEAVTQLVKQPEPATREVSLVG